MTAVSGSAGRPGADDLTEGFLVSAATSSAFMQTSPEIWRRTHPPCHWQGRLIRYYRTFVTPGQPWVQEHVSGARI
jgi:hypothetical protein